MKLPDNIDMFTGTKLEDLAHSTALQITLEYGIFVQTIIIYRKDNNSAASYLLGPIPGIIQFKVGDHIFENLRELRKALDNKSFL